MHQLLCRLIAAAGISLATSAFATQQPVDATGLWIKPDESGWGVSVYHQGDTLFASLFVYGPDRQPKWYTASNLSPGPFVFTGLLVEASGPWFGGPWDSDDVGRRTVGAMTFTLTETGATISYSVDGTQVTKPVVRFSMRPMNLTGPYYGVLLQPYSVSGTEKSALDRHITLSDTTSTLSMDVGTNRFPSGCYYRGDARSQDGEIVKASGTTLGPGSSCTGTWRMAVDPTPHGFVGNFSGSDIGDGRIAAALRAAPKLQGTGWANDLWFRGNEPGWGLNFIEQGDGAFATLFVFDSQRRPRWYSASQLMAMGNNADGWPTWSGTLEESTGPYFGGAFDPAAVNRRVVGTMTFSVAPFLPENHGLLTYTVDGVTSGGLVNRFAFRLNNATGSYQGHVVMREDDPRGASYDDATFIIDDTGPYGAFKMDITIETGAHCVIADGHSTQYGSQRAMSGHCAGGEQVVITDFMVTANGFTATYSGPAGHVGGFITKGHISGARR